MCEIYNVNLWPNADVKCVWPLRSAEEFKKEDESVRRKLKALNAEVDAKERRATDVEQRQLKLQQDLNALDADRLEIEKRQQGTVALQEKQKELGRWTYQ